VATPADDHGRSAAGNVTLIVVAPRPSLSRADAVLLDDRETEPGAPAALLVGRVEGVEDPRVSGRA
jgi:hypothetical protein